MGTAPICLVARCGFFLHVRAGSLSLPRYRLPLPPSFAPSVTAPEGALRALTAAKGRRLSVAQSETILGFSRPFWHKVREMYENCRLLAGKASKTP